MSLFSEVHRSHLGNSADKWQHYLNAYDEVLMPYQHKDISLLEIGVFNGGSLEVWTRYFPQAQHIVGCDINPKCQEIEFEASNNIHLIIGDAKQTETVQNIAVISPQYDIIIDDGSHVSSDIIATFVRLFPMLKEGGLYIVEDLHCSYWQGWEGGINRVDSSMQFLKLLADVVNFEHWDNQSQRADLFKVFSAAQGIENLDLSTVHSVTFSNSLCFIRKRQANDNVLGHRVVVGSKFMVNDAVKNMNGLPYEQPAKSTNVIVSDEQTKLYQQLKQQQLMLEKQNAYINQLTHYVQQLQQQLPQK